MIVLLLRRGEAMLRGHPKEAAMSAVVEIRAAEGGSDAKLLVLEQFKVYRKWEARRCL